MFMYYLLGLAIAWITYCALSLLHNLQSARTMGVPLIILPISPTNHLWIILGPLICSILESLSIGFGGFTRYARHGWHFSEKAQHHIEMGNAWAMVTPKEIFLQICDPVTVNDIFARPQDFVRPIHLLKMLEVYGPSVSTAPWIDWQRQRKIVAAPFNENTNKLVWSESLSQTRDMIKAWTSFGESGAVGMAKDTRTLSLDVLAATGFRRSYKFRASTESGTDKARNYRESLGIVLDNALVIMVMPARIFTAPFMPKAWKRIGRAKVDFKQYMLDMLNEEQKLLDAGSPGTGNLMSSMVRLSAEQQSADTKSAKKETRGLTLSEIFGKTFVINFAGHDTTANTLAYSVLLLAANPEIQKWVSEELDEVLRDPNSENWNYADNFPHLKRCQAVLLETIRLYPPIIALPKYTGPRSQMLRSGNDMIRVVPNTVVTPSLLAIHTHPMHWKEPLAWRPKRWISAKPQGKISGESSLKAQLEQQEIFVPEKGTYFPWSDGPQSCPGKKFAQVEFVAVIARLLREHRVRPLLLRAESLEGAQKRMLDLCENSSLTLLLRMRDADSVRLVWESKDEYS